MEREKRIKSVLFSNIPAPYFIDYCEELSKYIDLTVVFELKNATNRNDSWYKESSCFRTIFLKSIRFSYESALSLGYKKVLKKEEFDIVIVCNPTTPTGILLIRYLKKHKIKYAIQSEGGFVGSGKGIKERFKKSIISGANYYLSGMSGDSDYFSMYAHKDAKIYRYHFSSYRENMIDKAITLEKEKRVLRKELGIKSQIVVLYVGHFVKAKGYYSVLDLARRFKNDSRIGFCFAGGLPSKEDNDYVSKNNLNNILFLGFLNQDHLRKLYHASSLLVLPTKRDTWGLVINEAMANGLPVLTTVGCIAGLEFFRNYHDECLVGIGNQDELFNKCSAIINNPQKMDELANYGLSKIQKHSIENMAYEIFSAIEKES